MMDNTAPLLRLGLAHWSPTGPAGGYRVRAGAATAVGPPYATVSGAAPASSRP